MTGEPTLSITPAEPGDWPDDPGPIPEPTPAPAPLNKAGQDALRRLLVLEGEIVHAVRCGPDGPPNAWRWQPEEIDALTPALTALAERYEVAGIVNEHGPYIVAVGAVLGHVTRSVSEERRWRADHDQSSDLDEEPEYVPVRPEQPVPAASPGADAAGDEPAAGLGRPAIDHLSASLGAGRPLGSVGG